MCLPIMYIISPIRHFLVSIFLLGSIIYWIFIIWLHIWLFLRRYHQIDPLTFIFYLGNDNSSVGSIKLIPYLLSLLNFLILLKAHYVWLLCSFEKLLLQHVRALMVSHSPSMNLLFCYYLYRTYMGFQLWNSGNWELHHTFSQFSYCYAHHILIL